MLTVDATSGGIGTSGNASLVAGAGILVNDDILGSSGVLTLHSDHDSDGSGTFVIASSTTVTNTDEYLVITAWDIDFVGELSGGTSKVFISGSQTDQTIGVGCSKNMHLSNTELGKISAVGGLEIGSIHNGELSVEGVADTSSGAVSTISLVATKAGKSVVFLGTASAFNKGIVVQAMGGVVLSESVTTKNWPTLIYAGTGTLKTLSGKSLSSTNQLLTVTADDVDLQGDLVDSGTASTTLTLLSPGKTIGVGAITSLFMDVDNSDIDKVTSGGLTIGSASVNGSITVDGVTKAHSDTITGTVSLISCVDDKSITFATTSSTFHTMAAQADNGVVLQVDVTATTGGMYLDGDYENSSSSDGTNTVQFTGGLTVSAATVMTLESTTSEPRGTLLAAGSLTLVAGTGMVLQDSLSGSGSFLSLSVLGGFLTVVASKTISTANGRLDVTSADIDLQGGISTGTNIVNVHTPVASTIGLGTASGYSMTFSLAELYRVTSSGLTLGNIDNNAIYINGVTRMSSHNVVQILTLMTSKDDQMLTFTGAPSSFYTLGAQADNAVVVQVDVTATSGYLYLDGDYENSSSGDTVNDVQFADAVRVAAETLMTLESTTGSIIPAAKLTLVAGSGLVLLDDMTTSSSNSALAMDVDFESEGDGTVTVWAGKTVTSTKSDVTITAWDVVMDGSLTAGTLSISVHGAKVAQTIGLGGTSKDMHIESLELQRMSAATGLRLGDASDNHVTVNGIESAHSEYIYPVVTFIAQSDDAYVLFATEASTFYAVSAQADNAVAVQVDVTATSGYLYLDGDYENSSSGDTVNDVQFAAALAVSAETLMTLESTTGSIVPAAKLTLVAGSGLVLLDDMTTSSSNSALVMDVDFESEGDGTVTVWAGKTVTSTKSDVTITAWDVVMDGSLTAGTLSISVHGAKTSQTIGIGASLSQNMEILDGELGRLTAEAGLTIGTAVTGEIQVKGVTDGSSDSVGTITLVAMKDGTAVAFLGTASAFNKGIVVQAMGGVVLSESVTTKNWPTLIYAGTGTLKTLADKSLVSTNQLLTVTADDVDLQGDLVDSGTALMVITPLTVANTIGIGISTYRHGYRRC